MGKAERVAQTDYKKALMGSSYDKMFPGWSSMVNKDVFASYFGTTDYYYDLAKNTRRMVILDKVRVVQNIALNTTNPYAKLPTIFKETTVCYDMDDFIKALACQESGIIAYGTDEADKDENEDDNKKETFIQRLVKRMKEVNAMFDFVITNPPYSGSLHLSFFELGINHMRLDELDKKCGQMTIIEPATWLINVRKNGKASRYDKIKNLIKGHVKSIRIENLNKDFNIGLYVPLSITYVDFSKIYDTIDFQCCSDGVKKVKDIYDCNLIGDYKTIWSILDKVLAYGDMMDKHITNKDEGSYVWYAKYDDIAPFGIDPAEGITNLGRGGASKNDNNYVKLSMGEYGYNYVQTAFHRIVGITQSVPKKLKPGSNYTNPKYSDENADCVYGTKSELENWKHFIFNNKLPLFINIVLTIDQNNNSKEFLPWLVDKQYTDEEINEMFDFTEEEIALIDKTLKKFERSSSWFKRYMCGPDVDSTTKSLEADVANLVKGA